LELTKLFNVTQEDLDDPIYMGFKENLTAFLMTQMRMGNIDMAEFSLRITPEGAEFSKLTIY
jgi:hypothetical protein